MVSGEFSFDLQFTLFLNSLQFTSMQNVLIQFLRLILVS